MTRLPVRILWATAAFGCLPGAFAAEDKAEGAYVPIFNGRNLDGWDGDPRYWRVEAGKLIGETTPDNPLAHSSYILWKERKTEDFDLKLDYRLRGGNSGVQYRTLIAPGERWTEVKGYQADMEAGDRWSGILYEVGMRTFLALRGQKVVLEEGRKPRVVGSVGDPAKLQRAILKDGWNEYRITAQGNRLIHRINGRVMVDVTDNHDALRIKAGFIGFQIHQGPPMKVEYRNIRLKELKPADKAKPDQ